MDHADIRRRIEAVTGPLPPAERRCDLAPETLADDERNGLRYRKLRLQVEPGDSCLAWLIEPSTAATAPRPAMLCLHQTTRIGKDEPAGLGGIPDLHYASELAARGYVTLAPDYPRFGESTTDAYALGYASATMKGVWNHLRAMDFLTQHDGVDAARIGVIGHSLGGFNALMAAAYDPRLRCCVSSCGFTSFPWNDDEGRGEPGDIRDWGHAGYMPRIASHYHNSAAELPWDFPDVMALIAPRPLFINAPEGDFFQVAGVRDCVARTRSWFSRLDVVHPAGPHAFPNPERMAAYQFIDSTLSPPN